MGWTADAIKIVAACLHRGARFDQPRQPRVNHVRRKGRGHHRL